MTQIKKRGFTLIELLIVIVIIGLLASLVAPAMFSKVSSSQRKTAEAQMQMFQTALDTYRLDNGDYPDSLAELRKSDKPSWDGPYLPKEVPLDPWGNPYVYKKPGEEGNPYNITSYGKDGQPGGKDDDADIVHK
ncbi:MULTISPECIES: type II secretion system major pseudopilin GspG [Shewanella]|jgi:general secretion pathway protein G|uniref:type II secretion system major pseudopilin GspG n=1 Tax=Shewanella TaxID=22 RepID=UPI00217D01FA|nr:MULTISPECIES: type II secretion system major pseudopilin GspG [Shewanella]MCS6191610.1 type II secretion system major pseudopilin GspG [Shewanella baltica]